MEVPHLRCLNCSVEVSASDAKFFAGAFCCPTCFALAERLYQRGEYELKLMLLVLKESIRVAIVKKELQFNTAQLEDMPKKDLLSELARLAQEARQESLGSNR